MAHSALNQDVRALFHAVGQDGFQGGILLGAIGSERRRRINLRPNPCSVIRGDGVLPIQVRDARLHLAVGQSQRTCFAHEVRGRACWFTHKDGTGVSLDWRRQALSRRGCFPADDHEQLAATATENENGTPRSLKSKESAASLFSSPTISRSRRRRLPRAF